MRSVLANRDGSIVAVGPVVLIRGDDAEVSPAGGVVIITVQARAVGLPDASAGGDGEVIGIGPAASFEGALAGEHEIAGVGEPSPLERGDRAVRRHLEDQSPARSRPGRSLDDGKVDVRREALVEVARAVACVERVRRLQNAVMPVLVRNDRTAGDMSPKIGRACPGLAGTIGLLIGLSELD